MTGQECVWSVSSLSFITFWSLLVIQSEFLGFSLHKCTDLGFDYYRLTTEMPQKVQRNALTQIGCIVALFICPEYLRDTDGDVSWHTLPIAKQSENLFPTVKHAHHASRPTDDPSQSVCVYQTKARRASNEGALLTVWAPSFSLSYSSMPNKLRSHVGTMLLYN